MSKDKIDQLFNRLKNDYDFEAPSLQHEQRFLAKLHNQGKENIIVISKSKRGLWKPFIGIAASFALLFSIFIGIQQTDDSRDLASVSPKMSETQDFFTTTIGAELTKLQNETSPEAQSLVQDAMRQIKILEYNYESLKQDLSVSGDDDRVIYAMISNFQSRIDLLQNVLQQIENVKQLKNTNYENSTTI